MPRFTSPPVSPPCASVATIIAFLNKLFSGLVDARIIRGEQKCIQWGRRRSFEFRIYPIFPSVGLTRVLRVYGQQIATSARMRDVVLFCIDAHVRSTIALVFEIFLDA